MNAYAYTAPDTMIFHYKEEHTCRDCGNALFRVLFRSVTVCSYNGNHPLIRVMPPGPIEISNQKPFTFNKTKINFLNLNTEQSNRKIQEIR